jgi:hypothetical protein
LGKAPRIHKIAITRIEKRKKLKLYFIATNEPALWVDFVRNLGKKKLSSYMWCGYCGYDKDP